MHCITRAVRSSISFTRIVYHIVYVYKSIPLKQNSSFVTQIKYRIDSCQSLYSSIHRPFGDEQLNRFFSSGRLTSRNSLKTTIVKRMLVHTFLVSRKIHLHRLDAENNKPGT